MKCPHCQKEILMPTLKQQEAYRFVHILGLPTREAGQVIGISHVAVIKRLRRLKQLRPDLFDVKVPAVTSASTISLDEKRGYKILCHY